MDLEADHGLPAVRHAHAAPASAGGRGIERERALERVRGGQQPVLAEGRPGQVQPDRQTLREPARERDRGQAREVDRQREEVAGVHRERVVDELADAERDRRRGRREQDVALLEGLLEVAPDQRAHALRLAVVGVVVARRERVGADQAAPLDLAAEAAAGASRRTSRRRRRRARAGRSGRRRSGPGSRTPRPGRSGSRPRAHAA